ncbi:hypothetical protein FNV43_RR01142 [Rhamnella rubrinervis]|uniref:Uncharacterized protein n=1 Tax=Rhamnella rubrinervis TaxID=2594499 RepID=A0A8K0HPV6_9ROSA|nr:hypothetical protein FNV43_RR01142 [Rhamnella rubrinervis]
MDERYAFKGLLCENAAGSSSQVHKRHQALYRDRVKFQKFVAAGISLATMPKRSKILAEVVLYKAHSPICRGTLRVELKFRVRRSPEFPTTTPQRLDFAEVVLIKAHSADMPGTHKIVVKFQQATNLPDFTRPLCRRFSTESSPYNDTLPICQASAKGRRKFRQPLTRSNFTRPFCRRLSHFA